MDTNHTENIYKEVVGQTAEPGNVREDMATNPEEQRAALREAQNANRGYVGRGGNRRPPLAQVNIKCEADLRTLMDEISLAAGKTKRELLREALNVLKRRYLK